MPRPRKSGIFEQTLLTNRINQIVEANCKSGFLNMCNAIMIKIDVQNDPELEGVQVTIEESVLPFKVSIGNKRYVEIEQKVVSDIIFTKDGTVIWRLDRSERRCN